MYGHKHTLTHQRSCDSRTHTRRRQCSAGVYFLHSLSSSNQLSLIQAWMTARCCLATTYLLPKASWVQRKTYHTLIFYIFLLCITEPAAPLQGRTVGIIWRRCSAEQPTEQGSVLILHRGKMGLLHYATLSSHSSLHFRALGSIVFQKDKMNVTRGNCFA